MSVIYDFRQGWEDGRREQQAARASGYDNSLFWTDGVVARPREEQQPAFDNPPPRPSTENVFRGLFGGRGGGSSWPDERRALVELCERQQAEIARLADFEAAIAEREAEFAAALDERDRAYAADLEQWRGALDQRDASIRALHRETATLAGQLARAEQTRDRYQANGKRVKAEKIELESVVKFPGVKKALLKALHPDTGNSGTVGARTEIFKTLMAVFDRIAQGR